MLFKKAKKIKQLLSNQSIVSEYYFSFFLHTKPKFLFESLGVFHTSLFIISVSCSKKKKHEMSHIFGHSGPKRLGFLYIFQYVPADGSIA